ncbi:SdpI family protein [Vaginisenegalia massiliensis]|uniref:SdpI family protein n=1 Tax=Vaginisenegalia massiliensis TaxID=2058294 RepID=UPI0013DDB1CD|nr:SdpI family protein [Vaginisenegalia massiliensis]
MTLILVAMLIWVPNPSVKVSVFAMYLAYYSYRHYQTYAKELKQWVYVYAALAMTAIILLSISHAPNLDIYLFALLILVLGWLFDRIEYNPFVGIRIPSTRMSKENWRRTHHLLFLSSFPMAMLLIIFSLFCPFEWVLISILSIWTGTSVLYSLLIGHCG